MCRRRDNGGSNHAQNLEAHRKRVYQRWDLCIGSGYPGGSQFWFEDIRRHNIERRRHTLQIWGVGR